MRSITTTEQVQLRMPSDPDDRPINNNERTEAWQRKGLWAKINDVYKERHQDRISNGYSHVLSVSYFWFILVSGQYLMLGHIIPEQYGHWDQMSRYYLKLTSVFIALQVGMNCLCIRFYDSFIRKEGDTLPRHVTSRRTWTYDDAGGDAGSHDDDEKHGFTGRYCDVCCVHAPYRSHHCVRCRRCVLKRDHHCDFTGICVGFYNQRYFIVMVFYTALACTWGMYEFTQYMKLTFTAADYWDYFLPVTCFRWLVGWISLRHMLLMWHMYTLWWMAIMAHSFVVLQFYIIFHGQTTHEARKRMKIKSTATLPERFQSVFGHFWPVNFLFPAVLLFRQEADGTRWPDLRKG